MNGQQAMTTGKEKWPGDLQRLLEEGHKIAPLEMMEVAGSDPLEQLATLMERARREEDGEGGEALRRLLGLMEEAKILPEARVYLRGDVDPLEQLQARARGEDVDAVIEQVAKAPVEKRQQQAHGSGASEVGSEIASEQVLGRALSASLGKRPLSGAVRVEVAALLAKLMEGPLAEEIEPVWDLVVFGGEGGTGGEGA